MKGVSDKSFLRLFDAPHYFRKVDISVFIIFCFQWGFEDSPTIHPQKLDIHVCIPLIQLQCLVLNFLGHMEICVSGYFYALVS